MERLLDKSPVGNNSASDECAPTNRETQGATGERIANYGRLQYRIAAPEHEQQLRRAMRENSIPGWIRLSYEREPNYFLATSVEGDQHDTVIGIDLDTRQIMGIGSRSLQQRYVNGNVQTIGYLGQLRVSKNYRNKLRALKYGFDFCRQHLHSDQLSPYYLTSIISDNERAKRLLTTDLAGYPSYRHFDDLTTMAIPCRRYRGTAIANGVTIERGQIGQIDDIVACLNRQNEKFQFASNWSRSSLLSQQRCRGLSPEDFFVAIKNDRIIACLAVWDQSAYKQVMVRDYASWIKHSRPIINVASRLFGYPALPAVDHPVTQVYISHLAVENNNIDIMIALIKKALNHAHEKGCSLLLLGLSQRHPCVKDLQKTFKHIAYTSSIYLVHWNDTQVDLKNLSKRCLHLDIAVL